MRGLMIWSGITGCSKCGMLHKDHIVGHLLSAIVLNWRYLLRGERMKSFVIMPVSCTQNIAMVAFGEWMPRKRTLQSSICEGVGVHAQGEIFQPVCWDAETTQVSVPDSKAVSPKR